MSFSTIPFCETDDYFKAMATVHRFIRDEFINLPNSLNSSHAAMITLFEKYKGDELKIKDIIKLSFICARNTDTKISDKLYEFLINNTICKEYIN